MNKIISEYIKLNQYGEWMEMDFEIKSPGKIIYKMTVKKHQQAVDNYAHGGLIAGMMDGVLGLAALSAVSDDGKRVATVEFKINYLSPAKVGDQLIGKGNIIRKGKTLLVVNGEISNSIGVVAVATGTFTAYQVDS